jgi:hypothetical protein
MNSLALYIDDYLVIQRIGDRTIRFVCGEIRVHDKETVPTRRLNCRIEMIVSRRSSATPGSPDTQERNFKCPLNEPQGNCNYPLNRNIATLACVDQFSIPRSRRKICDEIICWCTNAKQCRGNMEKALYRLKPCLEL